MFIDRLYVGERLYVNATLPAASIGSIFLYTEEVLN
jgi:hypothetical protein